MFDFSKFLIFLTLQVCTQGDLMTGFGLLRDGYSSSFPTLFEHTARWKFWFSLVSRLSEGALGLVASFLLIVTATTVVELVSAESLPPPGQVPIIYLILIINRLDRALSSSSLTSLVSHCLEKRFLWGAHRMNTIETPSSCRYSHGVCQQSG